MQMHDQLTSVPSASFVLNYRFQLRDVLIGETDPKGVKQKRKIRLESETWYEQYLFFFQIVSALVYMQFMDCVARCEAVEGGKFNEFYKTLGQTKRMIWRNHLKDE